MLNDEQKVGKHDNPISAVCEKMLNNMGYKENERDMLLMYHKIVTQIQTQTQSNQTNRYKTYHSKLLVFGDCHYTAMARTVGFPVAIATQLLLSSYPFVCLLFFFFFLILFYFICVLFVCVCVCLSVVIFC